MQPRQFSFHALFLSLLIAPTLAAGQGVANSTIKIDGIPGPLIWHNRPVAAQVDDALTLTISSGPKTDWYVDPFNADLAARGPILTFDPGENFVLSAKVKVNFRSNWDAGALMLYADDRHWAKFAYELSAGKKPTLVSVVTRGVSDDCSSVSLSGDSVYLKIARLNEAFIFYMSTDGVSWQIQRIFRLDTPGKVLAGFESQSPAGAGSTSAFSDIHYSPKTIRNPFTGSYSTN